MNLDLNFVRKTFGEDTYGRHALREPGGHGDVLHLEGIAPIHGSRLRNDYQPRHGRPTTCQAALDLANAYVGAIRRRP